ncbi:MAG: gamma-glutamyltransferase [Gammaproteobacteria bacterium]
MRGAVAAGHPLTAEAATQALSAGGNAFDAAMSALCAACVVEPVLTSLGGGGFLLAQPGGSKAVLYDFFVQTPLRKRPADELDFQPIVADFGTATQEFHIGLGSMATPGTVRGLFSVQRELGRLPMAEIVAPAVQYARDGVRLNALQAYVFSIVAPIFLSTPGARAIYGSPSDPESLVKDGELLRLPEMADTLETLAIEGDRLFYEGEIGQSLGAASVASGGHLDMEDLRRYQVVRRRPLDIRYRDTRVLTNPPPSSGGLLIGFALELLRDHDLKSRTFGSPAHLSLLAEVMELTNTARAEQATHELDRDHPLLTDAGLIARYRRTLDKQLRGHPVSNRGTTHISVIDEQGNAASLTLSNGEGCGHVIPGTAIMMNNMLGEEDLNPAGFQRWRADVRVSSMMSPSLISSDKRLVAVGSGGSNRIRTAIIQTLSNLVDFGMNPEDATTRPRIHTERGRVSIEPGFPDASVERLRSQFADHHLWDSPNLFFGGAHTVQFDGKGFDGAGDPRRGGVFLRA